MKKVLITATVQSHICQFHRALIEMLRETDKDVVIHVAARDNLAEKNGLKLNFADKVFDVPFERSPFSAKNLKAYRALKKIISDGQYDIIHCNTPVGGILTRWAARRCRRKGTRVFYTAHGFHFYDGASKKNWLVYYPIEKLFSRYNDVLITINEEDYRLAQQKFKCPVRHIHGVGVDTRRYHLAKAGEAAALREKLSVRDKAILCVGELLPNKNQAMIIRAMPEIVRAVPDAQLLIAGNGAEKNNLEHLIEQLHMQPHVRLLGYTLNLEDYQRACALSVSCSRREGLGLNLIEGMLSGSPVVATKNRGHNELVEDGVSGYLVENDDVKALEQSVIRLLSDDRLYDRFSQKGRETALRYSFEAVKKELKDIYYGS